MEMITGKITLREIFLSHGAWVSFWLINTLRLRFAVVWNVTKMIRCRNDWGYAKYVCLSCNHERRVPHTCKSRFCSSCGKVATDRWVESSLSSLLDVPYQHLVFTLPEELRDWVQMNRKPALNALFQAAHSILLQYTAQHGYRPGLLSVLHTFGADLKFNAHLHLIITCGGLSLDGQNRWLRNSYLHHACLRPMWRGAVLAAFKKLYLAGQLKPPPQHRAIRSFQTFNSYLTQLYKKDWYIHLGHSLEEKFHTLCYVGRYGKRPVLAESKIEDFDGQSVTFSYRDRASGEHTSLTLPVAEFIGRLVQHIPDEHFRVVRHAGLFANRCRKTVLALARIALQQNAPPPPQPNDWRALIRSTFGVDPLLGPTCQSPLSLAGHVFISSAEVRDQTQTQFDDFRRRATETRPQLKKSPPGFKQIPAHAPS